MIFPLTLWYSKQLILADEFNLVFIDYFIGVLNNEKAKRHKKGKGELGTKK